MAWGADANAGADAWIAQRIAEELRQRDAREAAWAQQFQERELGQRGEIAGSQIRLGQDRLSEDARQFDEQAPGRQAGVLHTSAQTADIQRRPEAEATDRAHDVTMAGTQHQNRLGEIAAGGEQARLTQAAGDQARPGTAPPSSYAIQTARRTIQAVNEVLPRVGAMTAGPLGAIARRFPGTEASDVSADLSSVAANVAFNALQAMREASKTGGALGQVSERELDLLSSVEGSIRQDQSPGNLRKNLELIKQSQERWLAFALGQGGVQPGETADVAPPGSGSGITILSIEEVN